MKRREFLRCLALGLAGGLALSRPHQKLRPAASRPGDPEMRLAFLADAHLQDADPGRPEALALARAVAELRALKPGPDLVLFAGDLAHRGHPGALALGKEILAGLPGPLLMLRGEGDGPPDGDAPWRRLFGEPRFSQVLRKAGNGSQQTALQLVGLHTAWRPAPGGPYFQVGESGRHSLARQLGGMNPEAPLILLSHAPLDLIYRPWQQWTADCREVADLLAGFRQVLCLHGHTHNAGVSSQWPVASNGRDESQVFFTENRKPKTVNHLFNAGAAGSGAGISEVYEKGGVFLTENGKRKTANRLLHLSLPATSWPGPQALQGTPASSVPGLGPAGCGWLLLAAGPASLRCQLHTWQA
jgi:Calcineurin-like phosphoesterase